MSLIAVRFGRKLGRNAENMLTVGHPGRGWNLKKGPGPSPHGNGKVAPAWRSARSKCCGRANWRRTRGRREERIVHIGSRAAVFGRRDRTPIRRGIAIVDQERLSGDQAATRTPSRRAAVCGCAAQCRVARAMFFAPAMRRTLIARLRSAAIICGALPVRI